MQSLFHDLWSRLRSVLRESVGEAAYESWLEELQPLTMERSICYLEAKNRLIAERVERMFKPAIAACLARELGVAVGVEIVPAPDVTPPEQMLVSPLQPILDASNEPALLALEALLAGKDLGSKLFVIHGAEGAGKSYLLRWYVAQCQDRPLVFDGLKLLHTMQACLKEQRLLGLRAELAQDVPLVIDGVHRLRGHRRLQQELAQILVARESCRAPVIMASRHHPKEIWEIEPALASRLCAGFVVRLDVPGPHARLRYLRALEGSASRNGRAADVERLAREVRGTFGEVRRAWMLDRQRLDPKSHPRYLQLIDPGAIYRRLRDKVAAELKVPVAELLGERQTRRASFARQALAWLCVREGMSQAEVGRAMGGRSRAAISYAVKTLTQRMQDSSEIRQLVEGLG